MDDNKIVYLHLLDDMVVYVGSGSPDRFKSKTGRSSNHLEIWDKLDKVVIKNNLCIQEAKKLEQQYIDKYWNSGLLLNISNKVHNVKTVNFEELDKLFYYDESSASCLRWKISVNSAVKIGDRAGMLKKHTGYYQVKINKVLTSVHRIIYCLCTSKDLDSNLVIDHIDRVRSNNKFNNLRAVSHRENSLNKITKLANTGEKGISENVKLYRFTVGYRENNKQINIYFNYAPNGPLSNPRSFRDRDLALAAAIKYRDELVVLGKIYKVK